MKVLSQFSGKKDNSIGMRSLLKPQRKYIDPRLVFYAPLNSKYGLRDLISGNVCNSSGRLTKAWGLDENNIFTEYLPGQPRFTKDGLLIEGASATTLCSTSAVNWSNMNNPSFTTTEKDPLNGNAAGLFTRTRLGNQYIRAYVGSKTANAPLAFSLWCKPGTAKYISIRLQGAYPARVDFIYNVVAKTTFTQTTNDFSASWFTVKEIGDWLFFECGAVSDSSTNLLVGMSVFEISKGIDGTDSQLGASCYFWGANLSFISSSIVSTIVNTGTGSVVRGSEASTALGAGYRWPMTDKLAAALTSAGTLCATVTPLSPWSNVSGASPYESIISAGEYSAENILYRRESAVGEIASYDGLSVAKVGSGAQFVIGSPLRCAVAWGAGTFFIYRNGVIKQASFDGAFPTVSIALAFVGGEFRVNFSMAISNLRIYNVKLTQAEIEALPW